MQIRPIAKASFDLVNILYSFGFDIEGIKQYLLDALEQGKKELSFKEITDLYPDMTDMTKVVIRSYFNRFDTYWRDMADRKDLKDTINRWFVKPAMATYARANPTTKGPSFPSSKILFSENPGEQKDLAATPLPSSTMKSSLADQTMLHAMETGMVALKELLNYQMASPAFYLEGWGSLAHGLNDATPTERLHSQYAAGAKVESAIKVLVENHITVDAIRRVFQDAVENLEEAFESLGIRDTDNREIVFKGLQASLDIHPVAWKYPLNQLENLTRDVNEAIDNRSKYILTLGK